ncbi:MAG: cytochrome c biogenesis protein CcdA [Rhodanobacteraceae bacterium]|nr:MAG: cytochrome c biogenesis protein CcdA [Rhodanobacteraceae bacterium]
MGGVSFFAAFLAGLVSFLSPCVLPLVPGYLSYVSGCSFGELRGEVAIDTVDAAALRGAVVRRTFLHALLFVAGFTTVFVALGASASVLGRFLARHETLFSGLAGAIIILFGLHMLGVLRIPWLYREKRLDAPISNGSMVGSWGMGMAFAFGWTPCIGPILAGVLTLAATQATVHQGAGLLAIYSFGLGLPFLLAAFSVNGLLTFAARFKRFFRSVEIVGGLLLIGIGVLILAGRMSWLAQQLDFLNRFVL